MNKPTVAPGWLIRRLGEYWWSLAGVAGLVLGIVDLARAHANDAATVLLLGVLPILIGPLVGPRRMLARRMERRIGFVLEYGTFCALWVAVALSHRPPIENNGPWFDSGGIVLGAVVLAGGVGVGVGLLEAECLVRTGIPSALTGAALMLIYTALASITSFGAVTFLTSFNDNSPVMRGEWNGAWVYFAVLMAIPAVVAPIAVSMRQLDR